MGSMICCSSLEGKYEERDMENDNLKHDNDEIQRERSKNIVIQQPVLSRASSQQTLAPTTR